MSEIRFTRGDTYFFKFARVDSDGEVITTAANAVYFTVKDSFTKPRAIFQKTLADMTFDAEGQYHVEIEPSDTEELPFGNYVYDIEITSGSYVKTIAKGDFILEKESTWRSNK